MKTIPIRVLCLALSLLMLLGLAPTSALATGSEHTHEWTIIWSHTDPDYHWPRCTAEGCSLTEAEQYSTGREQHNFQYGYSCYACGFQPLAIDNSNMPAATVGVAYSASFSYIGTADGVVFWNATGLPDGLTIDSGTGVVSGTPTTAGSYTVTIAMGATGGGSASRELPLTVSEPSSTHTHVWSTDWSSTVSYHWHDCTAGGCDLNSATGEGKDGFAKHEFTIEADNHDEIDPTGFGEHLGTCDVCQLQNARIIVEAERKYDATHHWRLCRCGVSEGKEEHSYDDDADMTCNDCAYNRSVKPSAAVVKAPEAITGLKYNGQMQALITPGEASGGTMVYSIAGAAWIENIPTMELPKDYVVYYKVVGDSDHLDTEETAIKVTISKADAPTVSVPVQEHAYNAATTDNSVNIESLLPADCALVTEDTEIESTTGDFIKNAELTNGVLTYDTDAGSLGATGSIQVKCVMRYYEDVTVTVSVKLVAPVITLTPEDLVDGASGNGWKFEGSTLTISDGYTLHFQGTCTTTVMNYGTIAGGTFSGDVDNDGVITGGTYRENVTNYGTITGGVFTNTMTSLGTVTGTADLSSLTTLDNRWGGRYGKDAKLPKAVIRGDLTYAGCDPSTEITLHYFADNVKAAEWTVSGSSYSYPVEKYKRTDPDADLSEIETIAHNVTAVSMDGYTIIIDNPIWDRFHVSIAAAHTHSFSTDWSYDENDHWHAATCGHDVVSDKGAHSGGTATCTDEAECAVCAASYGKIDDTNHSFTKYTSDGNATCKRDGTETAKCDHGCGKTHTRTVKGSKLGHNYVKGVCTRCKLSQWNPETADTIVPVAMVLVLSAMALVLLLLLGKKQRKA